LKTGSICKPITLYVVVDLDIGCKENENLGTSKIIVMSNHMQNGTKGLAQKSGFVFYIEYVLLNKYEVSR
jgi:hypothetical protein